MALPMRRLVGIEISQRLDATELSILHLRGAFDLPPKHIQDELVTLFFKWVFPILPIIDRTDFMTRYLDEDNPPSLLLLQALFATVVQHSSSENEHGDAPPYFKRAKWLYDAGYEQDPVTIVQSLVLMSWYYDGPQDGTENGLFYWSKIAIAVAQDYDMHQSSSLRRLNLFVMRLRKRIWWTLFTRDRATSAAFGRPVGIFAEGADVEMIMYDDFIEYDGHVPDPVHVHFFLRYVALCKMLRFVAFQPIAKGRRNPSMGFERFKQCEDELNQWLLERPKEMEWQQSRHEFWAGVLTYTYYTVLCQLYGMLPVKSEESRNDSQIVVFEASSQILSVVESFVVHNQLPFAPPSIVYSIVMVLITLKPRLTSTVPTLIIQSRRKVVICMELLSLVSERWPVAQMLREASDIVFSEGRFDAVQGDTAYNVTTHNAKSVEQSGGSRLPYKRALPSRNRARPEFMLPQQRNVVRMALTTLVDGGSIPYMKSLNVPVNPFPGWRDINHSAVDEELVFEAVGMAVFEGIDVKSLHGL